MQTRNETQWTDAEWREAKKLDAFDAKQYNDIIVGLKALIPQWLKDMNETQLYNMVSVWSEYQRPPLPPIIYIPIIESFIKNNRNQDVKFEPEPEPEPEIKAAEEAEAPPLFKKIGAILQTPDQKYLIEPLLPMKGVALISALPAAGKTRIALSIGAAVVKQNTLLWHKYLPEKHGSVYIVDQENPTEYLKDNMRHYGITEADNLFIAHFEGLNIATDYTKIRDAILFTPEKMPALIIFDSLIRMHTADENSAKEMNVIMQAFRNLSNDLDCLVIILHHDRKSAGSNLERARGSTDITAGVDIILSLSRSGDEVKLTPLIKRGKPANPIELQDDGIGFRVIDNRPIRTNEQIVSDILEGVELSTQEIKEAVEAEGYSIGRNQLTKLLNKHFKQIRQGRSITWSTKE